MRALLLLAAAAFLAAASQDSHSQYVETCGDPNLQRALAPVVLKYDIEGGAVSSICKVDRTNSVVAKIDSESGGHITITIPQNVVYSLASADCGESDLAVLVDNEEVLPAKSVHGKDGNTLTVGFAKGSHIVEFVGFSILTDPAPYQYCGIVMGLESQYLPPKMQTERGMRAEQVKCNEGLALVTKIDGSPACVRHKTGKILLERGWAGCGVDKATGDWHSCARPVSDSRYSREITVLAVSPKNVTLPGPGNHTATGCNADGMCFTPE